MKKYCLFIGLFCLAAFQHLTAQTFIYADFKWEEKPQPYKPAGTDTMSQIVLQDKIAYQVVIENNIAHEYYFRHTRTFVNSDQAIERNNKVYLPSGMRTTVVRLDVRVIKPNGEIIQMNESDIKEAVDEDSERKYQYLAVRGLEQGSVVEELFVMRTPSDFTGRIFTVQSEYPKRNVTFELFYPAHLIFDTRSYNGFPKLEKDTTHADKDLACRKAFSEYIPALKSEKYSNRVAHVQKVAFKLTGNSASRKLNLNSYDIIADIFFQNLNLPPTKAEAKVLDKILSNAGVNFSKNEEDKIRKLEDYVKKNIFNTDKLPNNSVSIDKMYETKITDAYSLTRLYVAAFNKLNIEHELLVSCNRYDLNFANDFEPLSYLDKFFLHFPKHDKYLAPEHPLYRYGLIPYQYRNQYGLFVKKTSLGNLTTGLGEVRFVESDAYTENTDSLIIEVDFSKGFETPKYQYRITNSGHEAAGLQTLFEYLKDEKQKEEIRKSLVKVFADDADVEGLKVENEGAAYFANKPYVISAHFSNGKYVDKAGGKYIFKVGELIGPQEQLYQEETRKMPIEMNYCKNYYRIIKFKIPSGYKLSNTDKLNMDIFHNNAEGERIMAFRSWYDIKDNDVIVFCEEYYKAIGLPVSEYEPFKAVINAAADFNKIVLLFEPK